MTPRRDERTISINSLPTDDDDYFFSNIQNWIKPKDSYTNSNSSRSSWNEEVFQNAIGNLDVLSSNGKSDLRRSPVGYSQVKAKDVQSPLHQTFDFQTESENSFFSLNKSESPFQPSELRNQGAPKKTVTPVSQATYYYNELLP